MVSPKVRGRRKWELWIFFWMCKQTSVYQPQLSDFPPLYETSLIMPSDFLFSSRNLKITFQEKKKIHYGLLWPGNDVAITDPQTGSKLLKAGTKFTFSGFCKMSHAWVTAMNPWLCLCNGKWKTATCILLAMVFWWTCSKSASTL